MSRGPFSARGAFWLVAITGVSLFTYLLWGVFGAEIGPVHSFQSDAYSRSAVGHRALVKVLRALDIPVVLSRFRSADRAGRHGVLVIAEPQFFSVSFGEDLDEMLERDGPTILVLPKWSVQEHNQTEGWIAPPGLLREESVEEVLAAAGIDGTITRSADDRAQDWQAGELGVAPALLQAQVVRSRHLIPLVSNYEGTLLGKDQRRNNLLVLTDPDVISNYGLSNGDNAEFAVRLLEFLRRRGAGIVVDETLHGYVREPNVFRSLFDFPLALGTAQLGLTIVLLLLAAGFRFGSPAVEVHRDRAGKELLIDNMATLLRQGGHTRHALHRYLGQAAREVGRRLHVPRGLGESGVTEWLDAQGRQRGIDVRYSELAAVAERKLDSVAALYQAQRIHNWREDMIHGRSKRA